MTRSRTQKVQFFAHLARIQDVDVDRLHVYTLSKTGPIVFERKINKQVSDLPTDKLMQVQIVRKWLRERGCFTLLAKVDQTPLIGYERQRGNWTAIDMFNTVRNIS